MHTHNTEYSEMKDAASGPEKSVRVRLFTHSPIYSLNANESVCTAKDTVLSLVCLEEGKVNLFLSWHNVIWSTVKGIIRFQKN